MDIATLTNVKSGKIRDLIRNGQITSPTAGMATGYAQANLVILPRRWACDFILWARFNSAACPLLEVIAGKPFTKQMAAGANICTDIPKYRLYRYGKYVEEVSDVQKYWTNDSVAFLIGCSFSFEEALIKAGIEVRHITEHCNVPMFKTNLMTHPVGRFRGPMVVSMRPMTPAKAQLAKKITAAMPNVHGAPIQIGNPQAIGINDLMHPDYGDAVTIKAGEIPVFWPCGVTPQAAIGNAQLPLVITHAPGHMFITDIKNSDLNAYLNIHRPALPKLAFS
ncbi:putative hydro-lyase [Limosilactobacillus difficilis]|uniref:putative hydro-lyase n=1 Tax=Limosilactobacillus difficilis TaxID=2991838 RepID=UPI0024BA8EBD|nr:putative hydro-lyase [Limosilactobacillus difficilis]